MRRRRKPEGLSRRGEGASHVAKFLEASVCFFWTVERTSPEGVGLHHHEEDGNQYQDVYQRGDHAPDNRRGDGLTLFLIYAPRRHGGRT
jgi:hypothetical protein